MKQTRKRRLTGLMALLLSLSLALGLMPGAMAASQAEVDALKAKRDEIAAERAEKQAVVDELEAQQAGVLERKLAMDERNAYTLQQIELNEQEIALYSQMIEEKALEVAEAKRLEDEQLERYRVRVRAMEENGRYDFLALLLNTTDLGALLTTMDDIGEIMESDRELEDAYIAARQYTEQVKAEYEAYKAELEARQAELRAEQIELQQQIDEATLLIANLAEDIEGRAADIEHLRQQQDATQREIDQMVAELEAERRRREEEERQRQQQLQQQGGGSSGGGSTGGSGVVGTGSWAWPCPGCSYVTSRAGNRFHPVYNEWRYHSGLDIGASAGSAIVAADSGTVCWCGVKGGYGNCIMIDHGNGAYTLYGHMSGYAVSYGDTVSKGSTIGYVGSTGVATGPHLHFEVRLGDPPSPIADIEGYCGFSGLTYAPDAGT